MKTTKTILLAAALSIGVAAQAQTPETIYTGTSLPTQQSWLEWKLDQAVNTVAAPVTLDVSNGALKYTSVNEENQFSQLGWYRLDQNLNLWTGYTIELKAKLIVAQKGSFNIQGYDNSGRGFRVSISDTLLTNQSDPLKATQTVAELTNDNDFHVYRLAVTPSSGVIVYRDGVQIGAFTLSTFQFDNIIENGGFEDEEYPDFLSNGKLERTSDNPFAGASALLMDSDGKNNSTIPKESATTRAFPLKPNTEYEFSMSRRRAILDNEWAWRDLGAYWNSQEGTLGDVTLKDPNERWWNNCFETLEWATGKETFNSDGSADKLTLRFEFPSWIRDDVKNTSKVAIDNIILREQHNFGPSLVPA
ncbi:MAG: hypothetical protein LBH84_06470, partial [Prevotellaceae bacterium]|nr:hypothetical protein [Prevotellaceae bacterium]